MILRGDPETQPTDQIWRLQGGTEFPAHYHISPEHIVGISGELVFIVDREEVRVGSGDFLYSPSHMTHVGFCAEGNPCVYFVYDEFPVDFNLIEEPNQ
jgi:quercetin dioxygenase-like cupin family protein